MSSQGCFKSVESIAVAELIVSQLNVNIAFGVAFSYSKLSILKLSCFKGINKPSGNECENKIVRHTHVGRCSVGGTATG